MKTSRPLRKSVALVGLLSLLLVLLPSGFSAERASANNVSTVTYGFEDPADITTNFTVTRGSGTLEGDITRPATGGINNSGSVAVASSSGNPKNVVLGSKTTYTMAGVPVGATYTFQSFVNSQGTPGYSGMGFSVDPSTASAGSGTDIVYRPDDAIGVSVHGSGFTFHNGPDNNVVGYWKPGAPEVPNNPSSITPIRESQCQGLINKNNTDNANFSCASAEGWYRLVVKLEIASATTFNLRVEVWPSVSDSGDDRDPEAGAIYELNGITNAAIRNAQSLSSYVNFSGHRFTAFDDYSVTLDGGATLVEPGAPIVSTTSATESAGVVTVAGNLSSANGGTISDQGFVYATSVAPTVSNLRVTVGSAPFGTGSFSGVTPSLAAGTYYFRAFSQNENGVSYGAERSAVISVPPVGAIRSMGFTETAVESGKNVGNTLNGGTAQVNGVNGVCYAFDNDGTVTGLNVGSTGWAVTNGYAPTNTTATAFDHSFLFFYDGTSPGVPANCSFVTNTANPSVRSSLLRVYPVGELSSNGTSATLRPNVAMTPIQSLPNAGWPGVLTYSVSPSLPPGVSLNTSTGEISGTPTAVSAVTPYTVTAVTPRSGSRGDVNIWDATATITLAVQTASSGASSGGSSSGSSAAPTPFVPAPTVTPRPSRPVLGPPDTSPVPQPVERPGLRFDPDVPSRGTIGGVATNVSKTPVGTSGVAVVAGAFQFGVSLNGAQGAAVHTDTPSRSPELFMPRGESAAVSGSGSYPGSFVQLWLPNGTTSRELARIPVRSDGTFTSDVSFAAGSLEMPVPIGRQVLQVVGYDERGNQTVVDMTINIGQGAPAPEPNRQVGELPALAAGQSLGTSGGMPEAVSVTGLPGSGSVVVEGGGWVVSVSADRNNGVVENADGNVLVRLDQSSLGTTSGSGFLPGTLATVWLFSEPTLMATVTVGDDGEFSSEFLLDARLIAPGEHTLQIQGVGTDGYIKAANLGVLVEQPIELTTESASGLLWWVLGFFVLALLLMFFILLARRRRRQDA